MHQHEPQLAMTERCGTVTLVRARLLVGLIAVALIVIVAPGVAGAVRVSVSPTYVGVYRGSDTAGTVGFRLYIDENEPPAGEKGALSAWSYLFGRIRIAAKCSSPGPLRTTGQIVVPGSRFHPRQHLRFDHRLHGIEIRGVISGRLKYPEVHGTIQVLRPGCDHVVMPFTAALGKNPSS
jgi:hypothetical protein